MVSGSGLPALLYALSPACAAPCWIPAPPVSAGLAVAGVLDLVTFNILLLGICVVFLVFRVTVPELS